jgi:RNA recognition motif-containing protein
VCPSVSQEELHKEFQAYGDVILVRMFPRSKCCFITFRTPAMAIAALALQGKTMGTMTLTLNVGKASRHLWVGNVENDCDAATLRAVFERAGKVESVRILATNSCAFVNYEDAKDAVKAAEMLNGFQMDGSEKKLMINFQWENTKKVLRKPAMSDSPGAFGEKNISFRPSRQLFIGNIVPTATEAVVRGIFARFGELEVLKVFADRGYAFVVYTSLRVATWVRETMQKFPPVLGGRPLIVDFGKLVPEKPISVRKSYGFSPHTGFYKVPSPGLSPAFSSPGMSPSLISPGMSPKSRSRIAV